MTLLRRFRPRLNSKNQRRAPGRGPSFMLVAEALLNLRFTGISQACRAEAVPVRKREGARPGSDFCCERRRELEEVSLSGVSYQDASLMPRRHAPNYRARW